MCSHLATQVQKVNMLVSQMHCDCSSFGLVLLHGWQQRNWTDVVDRGLWVSCCLSATFFVWGTKMKIEKDRHHWFSNSLALYSGDISMAWSPYWEKLHFCFGQDFSPSCTWPQLCMVVTRLYCSWAPYHWTQNCQAALGCFQKQLLCEYLSF